MDNVELLKLSRRDTDPVVFDDEDIVLLGRPGLGGIDNRNIVAVKEL